MHLFLRPLSRLSSSTLPGTPSWASALLAALLLAGCGGSDSVPPDTPEPGPTPTPTPTLTSLQGLWQSAAGDAVSTSAIVLPDGNLWAVQVHGTGASATTRVLRATLAVQGTGYSATGKSYTMGGSTSAPATVPVAASVVEKTSLSVRVGAADESLSLAWQGRYDTSASLTGFAGAWNATLGPGTVHWSINDQGSISGSRTTGCTYTGQLGLRPERKAVVNVSVHEDCAGARTQFNGVATLNSESGRLSMVLTTSDETQAVVLGLAR